MIIRDLHEKRKHLNQKIEYLEKSLNKEQLAQFHSILELSYDIYSALATLRHRKGVAYGMELIETYLKNN